MKIHGDVISPFTRMCLVAAHELGLKGKVALVTAHADGLTDVKAVKDQFGDISAFLGATPEMEMMELALRRAETIGRPLGDAKFLTKLERRLDRPIKTTFSDKSAPCPLDHVNRQFHAPAPNRLWLSDFTYVSSWSGFAYVAFIIDAFARRIVGWKASRQAHAGFVLDALEQALHDRRPVGGLIHHSDRGSQYVSIKYTERLAEAGIEPSVGSVGDSYDNALAETINGLYKAEVIHRQGPWRSFEQVELATLKWVHWFNHKRILEPIGYITPAEAEANFYAALDEAKMAA